MPSDREKLKEGLAKPMTLPPIQRGKGVVLSTSAGEENAEELKSQNADTQQSVNAGKPESQNAQEPERTSRGFAIRADLVKALKQVALDEDKKLYIVLEEAIAQYLARRHEQG